MRLDVIGCHKPGVCEVALRAEAIPVRDADESVSFILHEEIEFDTTARKATLKREANGFLIESGPWRLRLEPSAEKKGTFDVSVIEIAPDAAKFGEQSFPSPIAEWFDDDAASGGPRIFSELGLPKTDFGTVWRKEFGEPGDPIRLREDRYKDKFAGGNLEHLDQGLVMNIDHARLIAVESKSYTMQSSITGKRARALFDALPAGSDAYVRSVKFPAEGVDLDDERARTAKLTCRVEPTPATCTANVTAPRL
jgi:hypothetical protein